MKLSDRLAGTFLRRKNLAHRLNLVFGLFFFFPMLGFLYFAVKYDMLQDVYLPFFFLGVLVCSFSGYSVLKGVFDRIATIAEDMALQAPAGRSDLVALGGTDELQKIVLSLAAYQDRLEEVQRQLEYKNYEIATLKELSELCYVTFEHEEILHLALERALALTNSDMGSVLILESGEPKRFVVKATVGLGRLLRPGDHLDFESSIAKYAVINKSPLVVNDIERDKRFGRRNLPHYGTKSFVCMPIKSNREIIGVLTLSSTRRNRVYAPEDAEILTPLLSNAAFTYENLQLVKAEERSRAFVRAIDRSFKILNSSFRDSELLQAVLNEIQTVVPFEMAVLLLRTDGQRPEVQVSEVFSSGPTAVAKGASLEYAGTVIEKVFKQETSQLIESTADLQHPTDRKIFGNRVYGAYLLTPLKTNGMVNGLLVLAGREKGRFGASRELVEWVVNGLSLAIERNRLTSAVTKRSQELETIQRIGSALASSTFDINKVLKYTMDMIREVMNVEAGSLWFLEKDELEMAVAFNARIKALRKFRLKIGQGIAGYVAARGEPIIVNRIEKSPHFFPVVDESSGFRTRAALCVPMISQGRVIGVIEVLNKLGGDFDADDRDLLQSIATSVCIALENARLYKETVSIAEHERNVRQMFQKFVPKEVVDKITHDPAQGRPVIEELKTITLLNIDIRGFSRLAKQIGSQKTVEMLNGFFSVMGGIVFKHHGIVDKYLGDGFLSLFGAPVSSTSDADNAIAAALEMKRAMKALNRYFGRQFGTRVAMGISIHTGEVVVGNIGFDKKMDYTVIGDAVNTVFRLQELTKPTPDSIIISESTLRAARSRLNAGAVAPSKEIEQQTGGIKVFQLLEQSTDKRILPLPVGRSR